MLRVLTAPESPKVIYEVQLQIGGFCSRRLNTLSGPVYIGGWSLRIQTMTPPWWQEIYPRRIGIGLGEAGGGPELEARRNRRSSDSFMRRWPVLTLLSSLDLPPR